jgi:hypothetical protein
MAGMSEARKDSFSPRPRIMGLPPFLAATMWLGSSTERAPKA